MKFEMEKWSEFDVNVNHIELELELELKWERRMHFGWHSPLLTNPYGDVAFFDFFYSFNFFHVFHHFAFIISPSPELCMHLEIQDKTTRKSCRFIRGHNFFLFSTRTARTQTDES